jgi:hypothetical protein
MSGRGEFIRSCSTSIPHLVRRARLVPGQAQTQFAEQFEADDGTVSRWELDALTG